MGCGPQGPLDALPQRPHRSQPSSPEQLAHGSRHSSMCLGGRCGPSRSLWGCVESEIMRSRHPSQASILWTAVYGWRNRAEQPLTCRRGLALSCRAGAPAQIRKPGFSAARTEQGHITLLSKPDGKKRPPSPTEHQPLSWPQ